MTRAILVCVLSVVPALAAAQSDADLITEALLPLPDQLRDEAAVVTMDAHGQRRVIREGKRRSRARRMDLTPASMPPVSTGALETSSRRTPAISPAERLSARRGMP